MNERIRGLTRTCHFWEIGLIVSEYFSTHTVVLYNDEFVHTLLLLLGSDVKPPSSPPITSV